MAQQQRPILVDVDEADASYAEHLGARYEADIGCWILPPGTDLHAFKKQLRDRAAERDAPTPPRIRRRVRYLQSKATFASCCSALEAIGGRREGTDGTWSFPPGTDFRTVGRWLEPRPQRFPRDDDPFTSYLRYCDEVLQQSNLDALVGAGALHATHDDIENGRLLKAPPPRFFDEAPTLDDARLTLTPTNANVPPGGEEQPDDSDQPVEGAAPAADEGSAALDTRDESLYAVLIVFGRAWRKQQRTGWATILAIPAAMTTTGKLAAVCLANPRWGFKCLQAHTPSRGGLLWTGARPV